MTITKSKRHEKQLELKHKADLRRLVKKVGFPKTPKYLTIEAERLEEERKEADRKAKREEKKQET
jgi:hypothetical protein